MEVPLVKVGLPWLELEWASTAQPVPENRKQTGILSKTLG